MMYVYLCKKIQHIMELFTYWLLYCTIIYNTFILYYLGSNQFAEFNI